MEVGVKAGFLMNFNVTKLKGGIKRFVLSLLRALRVLRGKISILTLRLPLGGQPSQGSERWSSLEPGWRLDHLLRGR